MILRQSTAVDILIGPFVDEDDGKTLEESLTISQADVMLSKNGQALAQKNDATACAFDDFGCYNCELDATDTNTVGILTVVVYEDGALLFRRDYQVIEEAAYDALYAGSALGYVANAPVSVAQWAGTNVATPTVAGVPEVDLTHVAGATTNVAALATNVDAILTDTAVIGATGGGLTSLATAAELAKVPKSDSTVTWNATALASINAEVVSATAGIDDLYAIAVVMRDGAVVVSGTIGATGNDTTHLHLAGLTFGDDELNGLMVTLKDDSSDDGEIHPRWITDWVLSTELATLHEALPFTPENSTDTFVVTTIRRDSGLTAAEARAAVGLASANLDTQIDALPTAAEIVNEWESQSQADPTGFHVNVLEIGGTAQTANDNGADINAILADTNELQGDWANGGRLDLILDARASQTSVDDIPTNSELATALDALPTAAENADAVWDEAATGHTDAGKAGEQLWTDVDAILADTNELQTDDYPTSIADIEGKVDDLEGRLTATRAGYLDNLSAGAVALEATAQSILTDTGTTLDNLVDDLETRLGTPSDLGSGATVAANLADIKAETASILDDTDDIGVAGAGLTALATAAALQTVDDEIAVIDGNVDSILVDTGTTLQAELDGIQADTEDIQSRLPAALVGGRIDATVDGTGMETGAIDAILTRAMTESYNTDGSTMTVAQALYLIAQRLTEFAISGTSLVVKQLDGSTTAYTLTLDDADSPTSTTRSS